MENQSLNYPQLQYPNTANTAVVPSAPVAYQSYICFFCNNPMEFRSQCNIIETHHWHDSCASIAWVHHSTKCPPCSNFPLTQTTVSIYDRQTRETTADLGAWKKETTPFPRTFCRTVKGLFKGISTAMTIEDFLQKKPRVSPGQCVKDGVNARMFLTNLNPSLEQFVEEVAPSKKDLLEKGFLVSIGDLAMWFERDWDYWKNKYDLTIQDLVDMQASPKDVWALKLTMQQMICEEALQTKDLHQLKWKVEDCAALLGMEPRHLFLLGLSPDSMDWNLQTVDRWMLLSPEQEQVLQKMNRSLPRDPGRDRKNTPSRLQDSIGAPRTISRYIALQSNRRQVPVQRDPKQGVKNDTIEFEFE